MKLAADPVILVLEDERAQLLSLRAQLHGLGRLAEFMEPSRALEYARAHPCDAAIVDVGMPQASMDGLAFVRALREFDRDLAIIIHTGSDSGEIADEAIELRAVKRAVKSKTTLADLRGSTRDAIRETRERRENARQARENGETQARLVEALGAYDLRLVAAEVHAGLVQSLRDQLTGLSALATVLRSDAAAGGDRERLDHADRNRELVARLLESVNQHLDSPWGTRGAATRSAVNAGLAALGRYFAGAQPWSGARKQVVVRDLLSDAWVECAPLEFVNALRHLAEYLLGLIPDGGQVTLTASLAHDSRKMRERLAAAPVVLGREAIRPERPYVVVAGAASLPGLDLEDLRAAFAFHPQGGRIGNLHVFGEAVSAAGGAVLLEKSPAGQVTLEAVLAVSL